VGWLSLNAEARLGETLEQCTQRYGDPIKDSDGSFHFSKSNFEIFILFYKGKAATIVYRKKIISSDDKVTALSEFEAKLKGLFNNNEVTELLRINGGESVWKEYTGSKNAWHTSDDKFAAIYNEKSDELTVLTEEYRKHIEAEQKAKRDRELAEQKAKDVKGLGGF